VDAFRATENRILHHRGTGIAFAILSKKDKSTNEKKKHSVFCVKKKNLARYSDVGGGDDETALNSERGKVFPRREKRD